MQKLMVLLVAGWVIGCGASGAGAVDAGAPGDGGSDAWGGDCETAPPQVGAADWNHPIQAAYATALGGPNHRIRDLILMPGEPGRLRGRFTYGAVDKDLQDEDVAVAFRRCPGWESWGVARTNHDGILWVDVPGDLPPGDYAVRMTVLGDGTYAEGVVAVWPAGLDVVVTDVDGTLTTSDWQAVKDVAFGPDAEAYPGGEAVMQRWAAKGHHLVYLSGRPQFVNRYSRGWLEGHGFPLGPIQLTEQALDVIPSDAFVRDFKADFLLGLRAKGLELRAAYGNATTDIGAYEDAALPKEDTFIVGEHAGEGGTQVISTYGEHLPLLEGYPDAAF